MAFRNGGGVKKSVKWIYDGKEVEVVASYEYRYIFFTKLSWGKVKSSCFFCR